MAMRTIALTTAMLAAALPSQVWAEPNWVWVTESTSGTIFYVDTNSIRRTGAVVRSWQRADYVNHRRGWKQAKALEENNCETGQKRTLQLTIY